MLRLFRGVDLRTLETSAWIYFSIEVSNLSI